jgi:hypothetical protein
MNTALGNKTLQAARDYLSRGFSVIPIVPRGKKPAIPWEEFQKRLPTDAELVKWFGSGSAYNIGIVTGTISGLAVIDLDSTEAITFAEENKLSISPTAKTGRGLHVYCKHKDGVRNFQQRDDLPGTDLRADGGYVVAPPSIHESGNAYEWVAGRGLDDVAMTELPLWVLAEKPEEKTSVSKLYRGVEKGGRNKALARLVGSWVNDGGSLEEIKEQAILWNENNTDPLPREEVEQTVKSIYERHHTNFFKKKEATAWPEPLSSEAYHGLAGDIVRSIEEHTEADNAAMLIQLITTFGNLIGKNSYFVAEADKHFMNFFSLLVGPTSKGRKGSSWGQILRPFETIDENWLKDCIHSGLSSGEGLVWVVRDPIEKQEPIKENKRVVEYQPIIIDPGVDDKRALIMESEFSQALKVLGRPGNTLSPVLRNAWDGRDLKVLTKNNQAKSTDPHISIIGHITKDELLRNLDSTEIANGLLNRILIVCVKRSKSLPEGGRIHEVNFSPLIDRLRDAVAFAKSIGEMKRDEAARTLWRTIYEELSEGKPGLLGAATARAESQVMRLSCVYALLDKSALVRQEHLSAALALWKYCEASAKFVFGANLGDPVADEIKRALDGSPEGLTKTDISNLFGRNKKADQIGRCLNALLESGMAFSRQEKTGTKPAERWFSMRYRTNLTN